MKTKNERWLSMADEVLEQNEESKIYCLRKFMRLSHLLSKYLDANLNDYDLNRTQRRILIFILSNKEPMTPTELSRRSYLSVDTINKSVDALDKMGLTRSYRSRKDRRVRRVTLTEKSLDVMEKSLPKRHDVLSEVMGCFQEEDVECLTDVIDKLLVHIGKISEKEG